LFDKIASKSVNYIFLLNVIPIIDFMKILLLLNLLVEGVFGLLFVFGLESIPVSFFAQPAASTLYIGRMYGFAAIAIAYLSFELLLKYHEQALLETGLLFLALFHSGICAAQFYTFVDLSETMSAGILHAVLALGFWIGYIREIR
jgi:hypothetical protein